MLDREIFIKAIIKRMLIFTRCDLLSSMATHINNVCEREYVKVVSSARRLVPTELGTALVHGYRVIDNELVAPDLRSSIETSVDLIAKVNCFYLTLIID
jgi:DNA topoisomerase-3